MARGSVFLHYLRSRDVTRDEIRGELDPAKLEIHGFADTANHQRLRESWNSHEKRVPARKQGHQDLLDDFFLPYNSPGDLSAQARGSLEERLA